MRYKVGDRVRVRRWETMEKQYKVTKYGDIDISGIPFDKKRKPFCGQVVTIKKVADGQYRIKEDDGYWFWIDEMFEGYAFKFGEVAEFSNNGERWMKRIYVGYADGYDHPYICVYSEDEYKFKKPENFCYTMAMVMWKYARPIPKKHTIIIDGVEIEVSNEDYKALKEKLCKEK